MKKDIWIDMLWAELAPAFQSFGFRSNKSQRYFTRKTAWGFERVCVRWQSYSTLDGARASLMLRTRLERVETVRAQFTAYNPQFKTVTTNTDWSYFFGKIHGQHAIELAGPEDIPMCVEGMVDFYERFGEKHFKSFASLSHFLDVIHTRCEDASSFCGPYRWYDTYAIVGWLLLDDEAFDSYFETLLAQMAQDGIRPDEFERLSADIEGLTR